MNFGFLNYFIFYYFSSSFARVDIGFFMLELERFESIVFELRTQGAYTQCTLIHTPKQIETLTMNILFYLLPTNLFCGKSKKRKLKRVRVPKLIRRDKNKIGTYFSVSPTREVPKRYLISMRTYFFPFIKKRL